jgi:hypothetical protein
MRTGIAFPQVHALNQTVRDRVDLLGVRIGKNFASCHTFTWVWPPSRSITSIGSGRGSNSCH